MKEIGGYLELDQYRMPMLYEDAVALNSARNCLAYIIRARQIKKILIPKFLCDSVRIICKRENIEVKYYAIGLDFLPEEISLKDDEWLYLVNYYGQISNVKLKDIINTYKRVIIDNVQSYFQSPIKGVDTIYTCRKFFGVPDGAFLYTDVDYNELLEQDVSYERVAHILGRYEDTASTFYGNYTENEKLISTLPVMKMSKLTKNLLCAIDYDYIKSKRKNNFCILENLLGQINKLDLLVPEGAFMYPLYISSGGEVRKKLQEKRIFIPILWPDVFDICSESELEYDIAMNILPIPVDQRYNENDMRYIAEEIIKCIN